MAKGLELPINMIIVIAIAVLVLVVISAFFASQTGSGISNIQFEAAFNSACSTWRSTYNCQLGGLTGVQTSFNFLGQSGGSNLQQLCNFKITGVSTGGTGGNVALDACQRVCGCSV